MPSVEVVSIMIDDVEEFEMGANFFCDESREVQIEPEVDCLLDLDADASESHHCHNQ
jgi:hypothetical protein